ncbi:MAG: hypothetical protein F4W95_02955 [Chloroflexi bacterium]|nr:hypothetical protein [Chloroflexota bacterium]MYD47427.1 hypothetical protein [Chloroflexota bacterium]
MPHNFWMINCSERNFDITRDLGFMQQGLKAEYRRKVQRVEPGDRIIYYVNGARTFTATATVTKGYEEVGTGPWVKEGRASLPWRIGIKPDIVLDRKQYINAGLIAYRLEYLRKWPPEDWYLAFQGNLHLLSKGDFFLLESEMLKLRDGRETAIRQIDAELAAEEERVRALRERRRRTSERNPDRASDQSHDARTSEVSSRQSDESQAGSSPIESDAESPSAPAGNTRAGGRNRRHQPRPRKRRASANEPKHDAN